MPNLLRLRRRASDAPRPRAGGGRERWIGLALLGMLVAAYAADLGPITTLRAKLFDVMQAARPRAVTQHPVIIVDIDDDSLAVHGQWPWPRTVLARLVERLTEMGAALIGFDIIFLEPDRLDPGRLAGSLDGLDAETRARLQAMPDNDAVFANAIRASRVVLGRVAATRAAADPFLSESSEPSPLPPLASRIAVRRSEGVPSLARLFVDAPVLLRNIPELEAAAVGHGLFSLFPEADGIVRRVPMAVVHDGDPHPTLALEILRVAFGQDSVVVEMDAAGVAAVRIAAGMVIPTDRLGRAWPYFSGPDPSRSVSAHEVLSGTVDPARIRDRLLLIGTSASGLLDMWSTPVEPAASGVAIHAQLIENALAGTFLHRPRFAKTIELALLVVGGGLILWLIPRLGAGWTLVPFVLLTGGAIAASWTLFSVYRVLIDVGFAVIAMLLLFTVLSVAGRAREQAGRRRIRTAFSRYLAPAMVERLAENPQGLRLGGETRTMSILFCDVRNFTAIAEASRRDPEGLTRLINRVLTPLTEVVLARHGTVDKYIGDCLMAFWNAPLDDSDHARHACLAALEMQAAMHRVNETPGREVTDSGPPGPLAVGIGINTGAVVVGNMGSDQRFDYSVLGDAVNLAARFEALSKDYRLGIIVGEETRLAAEDLAFLEVDWVQVRGRGEASRIFTVVGDEEVASTATFRSLADSHARLFAAFRQQQWRQALEILEACRQSTDGWPIAGLYDVYEQRLQALASDPPRPDRDGAGDATPETSHKSG
ncbi:MAG: adenylate/guanylate cyclase domain-containing protein [Rhodospirillales bacterium]|nr:adenylate/guanylate cyclase domain-containing protein [Rhodospirillales bacterium]